MNHGHFFKLNQSLSDFAKGVVIYDYLELPAYQGLAKDNSMSPKYPICLVITADSVSFMMHYSAFKSKWTEHPDIVKQDYRYAIEEVFRKKEENNIVHAEEVILELPFVEDPTDDLTDIIKSSYIANFPQVTSVEEIGGKAGSFFIDKLIGEVFPDPKTKIASEQQNDSDSMKNGSISYSKLWLMDLYKEDQYDLYDVIDGKSLVTKFLRKLLLDFMFDLKHSSVFSTSQYYDRMYNGLMSNYYFSALMHKCEFYYYRELTIRAIEDNEKSEMQVKEDAETETGTGEEAKTRAKTRAEIFKNQITRLYAQELFKAEELWAADIRNPLADKYFEQNFPDDFKQNKWLKWLNGKHWTELRSNLCERMTTARWDSWFANPEEEMRRIFFVMKENGVKRICNSLLLAEHFAMNADDEDYTVKTMVLSARQNRGNTSRWFLNRYDFNDVLNLHLFKRLNLLLVALSVPMLLFLFKFISIPVGKGESVTGLEGLLYIADNIRKVLFEDYRFFTLFGLIALHGIAALFIVWGNYFPIKHDSRNGHPLLKSFRRFRYKRIVLLVWVAAFLLLLPYDLLDTEFSSWMDWLFPLGVTIGVIYLSIQFIKEPGLRYSLIALPLLTFFICFKFKILDISHWTPSVWALAVLLVLVGMYLILDKSLFSKQYRKFSKPYIHPIESWHLLLPKLVASITAAWLTIAMGFDALAAFFDSGIVWSTMSIIIIVVFSFILYQIDRELPESSSWLKVYRTFEMLIISYCLSLCVGVIIINFVGERYLERSGAVETYYDERIYEHGLAPLIVKLDSKDTLIAVHEDSLYNLPAPKSIRAKIQLLSQPYTKIRPAQDTALLKRYPYVMLAPDTIPIEPILARKNIIYSKRGLLIIPDFLVMFSFVAMFIGVFLQMVFFERKKMTEF